MEIHNRRKKSPSCRFATDFRKLDGNLHGFPGSIARFGNNGSGLVEIAGDRRKRIGSVEGADRACHGSAPLCDDEERRGVRRVRRSVQFSVIARSGGIEQGSARARRRRVLAIVLALTRKKKKGDEEIK